MKTNVGLCHLSVALFIGSLGILNAGPVSPLYLTGIAVRSDIAGCGVTISCPENVNQLVVVQGTNVVNSAFTHTAACGTVPQTYQCGNEAPLAVGSTVRTIGANNYPGGGNPAGAEYTLGLTYTGVDYTNPLTGPAGAETLADGTRDALHNYAISGVGNIYAFDLNWQSPSLLFSLGPSSDVWSGIAYDSVNNSLWVSSFNNSTIEDFSLGGVFLSSFVALQGPVGLALDPADQTLWTYNLSGGVFKQYSKAGVLLSTQTYAALSNFDPTNPNFNVTGAEFAFESAPAPEPSVFTLFGVGLAMLGYARRRRSPEASA